MNDEKDVDLEEQLKILDMDLGDITSTPNAIPPKAETVVSETIQQKEPQQSSIPSHNHSGLGVEGVNTSGLNDINVNSQVNNHTISMATPSIPKNNIEIDPITKSVIQKPVQQVSKNQAINNIQQSYHYAELQQPAKSARTIPQQPVQQSTQVVPKLAFNAKNTTNDEYVFMSMDRIVNMQKTPWLKLKEGEKTRIYIPDLLKIGELHTHYIKGLGMVKCLSTYNERGFIDSPAQCCKKIYYDEAGNLKIDNRYDEEGREIRAKLRYLLPVIEYPVNKSNANAFVPGQNPELKMWNLNYAEWKDLKQILIDCSSDPGDITTADLANMDFILTQGGGQFKTKSVGLAQGCFKSQYNDIIDNLIAGKMNEPEFYNDAMSEARKIVSEETIAQAYDAIDQEISAVNNAIKNQNQGTNYLNNM